MRIETARLRLRDFTMDDIEALAACRRDGRYWQFYDADGGIEAGARDHVELFVRWQAEQPRTHFQLAITLKQDGRLIGDCGLRRREQVSYGSHAIAEADIGYELDPRHWGNGYATEAVRALIDYGFETLRLHRVWAYCLADNEASWRVMERLGMRREGILKRNVLLRNAWMDTYVYALLAEEWHQGTESKIPADRV